MYIYKFTHISTGRSYIGQTIQDPDQRRLEHISASKNVNIKFRFYNAIRKYGIDSFIFEVIDTASTLYELNLLEEQYINKFDSINNGFNIRQGGNNKKHNLKSIQLMSTSQKAAHQRRKETGIKTQYWNKGKSGYKIKGHSDESKRQRSIETKERYTDPKYYEKFSKIMKESHSTEEFKNKMKKINSEKAVLFKNKTWKLIDGKRVWMEKE